MPLVWSEVSKRNWDLPDYYSLEFWTPKYEDAVIIIASAVLLTFARVFFQRFFLQYAEDNKIKKAQKFSESSWKCIFYVISFTSGYYLVLNCHWFPNTFNCWEGFPNVPRAENLRYYYLLQLGFYCHSLYAHFAMEVKRSDWWPLLGHHIVTIFLIYFSYGIGYHRIGLLILVCHDLNDIFLESGKVLSYMKMDAAKNVAFLLFFASWLLTRLGIFPFMILPSTLFEVTSVIPIDIMPFYFSLNACLLFLLGLHIYWFSLMVKLLLRVIQGKDISDSREKKEEEEDDDDSD